MPNQIVDSLVNFRTRWLIACTACFPGGAHEDLFTH
jgi:hypothetical protein